MNLSPRLLCVAKNVPDGAVVHDVGTDHGYLPIYLLETHRCPLVYASDLREEPLKSAANNGASWIQKKQLILSLQDGFFPLNPAVDCLTISGLGGPLMADMIRAYPTTLQQLRTIVLQPQTHSDVVRRTLNELHWMIVHEELVKDGDIIYEVIVWQPGQQTLSLREIVFGPILLIKRSPLFREKWMVEAQYLRQLLTQIPPSHPSYNKHHQRLMLIEEQL